MLFHSSLPAGSGTDLSRLGPDLLAAGFSTTYIGMGLIATLALLITLQALKRHELATINA